MLQPVHQAKPLVYLLLFIGIGAYIYAYVSGRSLFLDEANLGMVMETVPFAKLFLPLPFEQYAPPLFLLLSKTGLLLAGHHEWGLRLIPLLASLSSLIAMFYLLAQLNWSWEVRCFVMAWMAFSPHLIRYASECKQYSWDVLIIILLVSLAIRLQQHPPGKLGWVGLSILFIAIPWMSMPAVFVLASWGGAQMLRNLSKNRRQTLLQWAGVSLIGLGSFLIYYNQVIGHNLDDILLLDYHRPYFMPWRFFETGQLGHAVSIWSELWAWAFGHTALSLYLGLGCAIAGLFYLRRKNTLLAVILVGPIALALIASMGGKFTLIPRVNLFMMPLFLLLAGAGIQWGINIWTSRFQPRTLILVWVLCLSAFLGKLPKLWQEPEIENLHGLMIDLSQTDQQIPWYIHWNATPAFRYYSLFHQDRQLFSHIMAHQISWIEPTSIPSVVEQDTRFWLVFSHLISDQARMEEQEISQILSKNYHAIDTILNKGAMAVQFQVGSEINN